MLKASPFLGEGHRKVKARLAAKGRIRVGKNRVLRLMREHGLLAPVRQGHPRGDRSHSGRIRTERPDELWGTDASRFLDEGGGLVLVLRGHRPLRLGRRRLSRREEGRPLGGAGASPPGRPSPHGRLRQGHRAGPRSAAREPGQLLTDAPKLAKTVEILDEIRELNEKVVVYTRLKVMQRIIQSTIRARFGFNPSVLNGEVTGPNRHRIVEAFNRGPGFDAMILSPEAAGVGLNITGATHVIHYTRLWNPAKENQATDRVHRIGQSRPVTVHYPVVVGDGFKSVEEHLNDLLQEKLRLARNVLVPRKSLDFVNELERRVKGGQ